jgi:cytochrome c heme-lyase
VKKQTSDIPSACPVKSPNHPLRNYGSAISSPSKPSAAEKSPSTLSKLNPLNLIPAGLTNTRTVESPQTQALPLSRETSSIPRGDVDSNWEYPSPQQMYNAMLRKGNTDIPVDAVESMVAVHNFLNEGAWSEICEWEHLFSQGWFSAWNHCKNGEQGIAAERSRREFQAARREALGLPTPPEASTQPKLLRFQGRPNEPTPKARILSLLGYCFPESFGSEPPFDRHDWYVSRKMSNGQSKEVRYVIDYYSGGVQDTGEPVFYLDIRPALDSPAAAGERAMRWGGDVWYRASGASVRNASK